MQSKCTISTPASQPIRPVSARRRKQRGHAMMEGGLVIVPFFAIMFGFVDFGMAIFLRTTFQHASREGTRYAVTFQTMSGMGQDASIKAVVQENAMGFLSGSAGSNLIQIRYYNPNTFALQTGTGSNSAGSIVEVSIEGYQWGIIAPVLRNANPIPLDVRSSDRMESLPGGTSPPAR